MSRETTQTQQQPSTSHPLTRGGILQRKCVSCGQHGIAQGECQSCKKIGLQRKLTIGASNDPLEREADRVADQVMAASAHPAISGTLPRIQRYTGQMTEGMDTAPASVDRVLSSPGRPLDPTLQKDMGQRFGHDFSRVRVHTDAAAERSARDVNANAYTVENNIVFGAGQFAPGTHEGRRLMAHELTHVVQQIGVKGIDANQRGERVGLNPVTGILQRQVKRGGAAGCGICLNKPGDPTGSKTAGVIAHAEIQEAFTATNPNIVAEYPIPVVEAGKVAPFVPKIDLSYDTSIHGQKIKNIGEIKPLDDKGEQVKIARKQLQDYARELRANPELKYDEVFRMRDAPPPNPLPFFNPAHPPGCPPQMLYVNLTEPGIYQYYCEPPFSTLVKDPRCKKKEEKEKEQRKVKEVAKPEQEQEKEKKKTPQQPKVHDDDSILPEVATAAAAAAAAYLRKRAIQEAEKKAAQLAWRKMAEAAAARRAAQAAGKGVAGEAAGKAVVYAAAAAAAALILFYPERVEAKPGPGSSAIESLYKAMTTNGTPPSPELKQLIESDPLLNQLAEEAAGSGDGSKLQEEMTRRTLELIRDNPNAFTPEDLEFLTQYSKTAKDTGQSPQTVEQLRKAIDAAKAGKTGTGKEPSKSGEAGKTPGGTEKPADEPAKEAPNPEEVKLVGEIKKDEKLKKIYDVVFGPKGVKVDQAMLERFLALKAKLDAHPELVDVIIKNSVKGNVTDPIKQLIEPIEQLLADAEKQKTEPKQGTPPADQPATTPAAPQKDETAEASKAAASPGPSEAEKASATGVEFWKLFDDAKVFKSSNINVDPDETELPTTTAVPITWTRQTPKGKRTYEFSMPGTLKTKLESFDTKKFRSAGTYDFSTPSKLIKSDQGDEPIYFTDVGVTRQLAWGFLKGSAPAKKSAKK